MRGRGKGVKVLENSNPDDIVIRRGLNGVYFDRTWASYIDGKVGELQYRGYSIHDLAQHSTFEETAFLLLHGTLPTKPELGDFDRSLKAARVIPSEVIDVIRTIKDAHPMEVLRTATSALSAFDPEVGDNTVEATLRRGIRLTSQLPIMVMTHEAIRNGRDPVQPSKTLSHAANFLYMLRGEEPAADTSRLMDIDFILHAEHGSNASSFTARVISGTNADFHAAVVGALSALSGPSHGGAAENVMQMAMDIGPEGDAEAYVRDLRTQGKPVMGFGHRVYKTEDPRARHLRAGVQQLSVERNDPRWYAILEDVVKAMKPYARRGIHVNVDFYAGVIYYLNGFPPDLFVPIFAVGRVPGWTVQVIEQLQNNILIRPLTHYAGPMDLPYVPLDQRG